MPLRDELGKASGFDSPEQEAYLNLARSAHALGAPMSALFKRHGLSESGYNVLRIVRGSGPRGRPSTEIGKDMVVRVPDVTRLVDRLCRDGLVERARCEEDRRVVYVTITPAGRRLLTRLDPAVLQLHRKQFAGLNERELATLSRLLVKARASCPDPDNPDA